MSARDIILNHLRTRTDGAIPVPESDFSVMTGRGWDHDERLARFEQLITSVHAEVVHAQRSSWTQALAAILHDKGIKRLALGHEHPVACEARAGLAEAGVELVDPAREIERWQREQFERVDAGLTSTGGAIAETGSLWLWPTPDEPRRLSLVPSIHIAVLDSEAIDETFFDVIEAHGWARAMPTNALLVSGPSKTADIEQTLAYGVHGPKELVVIVRHGAD
ncbi:LutC/YkgG family protein [Vreelandella subglaciescola]|jgi:L-lactate dehydrogenase complex protein LldG|uniref:L-lactate dehydrogenase complex protein LldG n=1 Tax=Vreelandella subglaciescola TaxID=29571 RepID=A0A1M7HQ94_9GAMM|nr:lactate utilization protein C [Halomonas subglaciescola]SHM30297.1 L-lactate dehydrogenase complex protein LldG [Halomonas subglaciescola]